MSYAIFGSWGTIDETNVKGSLCIKGFNVVQCIPTLEFDALLSSIIDLFLYSFTKKIHR